MPDPIICQSCRNAAGIGNYYIGDFNGWICPAKTRTERTRMGMNRKHEAIAKEAAPPKGCRKLFEQLIARTTNA